MKKEPADLSLSSSSCYAGKTNVVGEVTTVEVCRQNSVKTVWYFGIPHPVTPFYSINLSYSEMVSIPFDSNKILMQSESEKY